MIKYISNIQIYIESKRNQKILIFNVSNRKQHIHVPGSTKSNRRYGHRKNEWQFLFFSLYNITNISKHELLIDFPRFLMAAMINDFYENVFFFFFCDKYWFYSRLILYISAFVTNAHWYDVINIGEKEGNRDDNNNKTFIFYKISINE